MERLLEELQAVHGGHSEVGQNGAAAADTNFMKRVLRIRSSHNGEAIFMEPAGRDCDLVCIIVKNADGKILRVKLACVSSRRVAMVQRLRQGQGQSPGHETSAIEVRFNPCPEWRRHLNLLNCFDYLREGADLAD